MAVGTPVVAYASGAIPEVLEPSAELVSTRDRAGLADAMVRVLEDQSLRAKLATRGRERAGEFDLDATLPSIAECLREAAVV